MKYIYRLEENVGAERYTSERYFSDVEMAVGQMLWFRSLETVSEHMSREEIIDKLSSGMSGCSYSVNFERFERPGTRRVTKHEVDVF